ncbi:hypothetical protein BDP27DRAFT_1416898 [Rhodocollybia butyracea]|uniref:DUF6533 domain-containing protein n=1 Tax=Rhodocollybia butyracea TaxID=206335 RepID=A0A9P5Q5A4_9AGAR|nr:hypothetical protein BDP27DRAFT_1416898 [Rhodocollybia butyracea]
MSTSASQETESQFLALYRAGMPPLYVCLVAFTWGVHDYFITVQDEIKYIWPQKLNFSKFLFLWIRYYTLILLLFDVIQIHVFTLPGVTSDDVCVAMDSVIRVVGALSLWSVEIIMQLRVYALYDCSRRVAIFNFLLFLGSIAGFLYVLIFNAERRRAVIADAIHLPLAGCPVIDTSIEWAQWVPATAFEGILFGFALYKTASSTTERLRKGNQISLYSLILRDNLVYFFGVACLLVVNNLMVVGVTHIPWFSYGPFHAAVGILTTRMLINLRKASCQSVMVSSGLVNEANITDRAPLGTWQVPARHPEDDSTFSLP